MSAPGVSSIPQSAARRGVFTKTEPGSAAGPKPDSNIREREFDKESDSKQTTMSVAGSRAGPQTKDLDNYVGFASLPNQLYRKSVKRGFEFTLMVVGESGLGKSTLVNSMFLTDIYNSECPGPSLRGKKTVEVETRQVVLKENGVQLRLTVVDTPGFGDSINNTDCWRPIVDYIDCRYEDYMNADARVNRCIVPDSRVHCCLYFIAPNGHGLKALDIEVMKSLHNKVNIIPLIAKADTMTPDECRDFKKTILNEIAQHKINIYEFPLCADEEENKIIKKLKDRVPFAIIGSNTVVESQGKKVRGRTYPWGTVEVENLEHNDFVALRNVLLRLHMHDLRDVTNNVHYENFRYNHLASVTSESGGSNKTTRQNSKSPMVQMDEERHEHIQKMKKMEAEMEQVFELKVKEKMQKLRDSETDLQRRAEQMKRNLEQQEKELEEKIRQFEMERDTWDEQNRLLDDATSKKKKTLF